jgi:RNA polymerase sigma-70 factor (ECF subfamily)
VIASEQRLRGLLLRGMGGDGESYHLFLKEISAYLRSYFRRRLTRLPNDVEDLVQEAVLAIHNQRHTYDPAQPLTAWAFAIARYKMVDLLRRYGKHEALNVPLDEESDWLAAQDIDVGTAQRDVLVLLERLPDRQRLPIQHVKLNGLSVAETARLIGFSESAVKVGIHRGLKLLAAMMRGEK